MPLLVDEQRVEPSQRPRALAFAHRGLEMINIYDSRKEELRIGPYFWMPFPHVDFWLQQDDEHILQNLSTSLVAESPHFVSHIRATLMYLKEHSFPDKTLFPSRRLWIYRKNSDGL
ncbi:protein N-terminal asparagine amidohydrolase-like [Anolis sagrei]|uniref:protein N-terminal asparagine amidohydrolase-like n=1 Tax=Anolis sagrei TaxID=38937 RepID=UPI003521C5E8